jgi:hypothetical protein
VGRVSLIAERIYLAGSIPVAERVGWELGADFPWFESEVVVDKSLYLEGRTTSVAEFITCWTSFPVLEEAFDLGAEFIYRLAACSPICCVE